MTLTAVLSWIPNPASGVTAFLVERKVGAGEWVLYATTPLGAVGLEDEGLIIGEDFRYRVRAFDPEGGISKPSAEVLVSTKGGSDGPSGLEASLRVDP